MIVKEKLFDGYREQWVGGFPPFEIKSKQGVFSSGDNGGLRSMEKVIEDKQGVVPQLGKDGFVSESNQNNLEMVVSGKDGNCKEWRNLFPYPQPITPQPSLKFKPPVD